MSGELARMKIDLTAVMPTHQHLLQWTTLLQLTRRKVVYKRSPCTYPPPPPPLPLPITPTSEESPPPPPTPPPPLPTSEEEGAFSFDLSVSDPMPPHQCYSSDPDMSAAITVDVSQGSVQNNLSDDEVYGVAKCPSSKRNDNKWIESSISFKVRRGGREERNIDS